MDTVRAALVLGLVLTSGVVAVAQDTTRVSVDSSGTEGDLASGVGGVAISANGQVVAFESKADNLVAGDTNRVSDVFVHDRTTGVTELVSVDSAGNQGNAASQMPAISADGQIVAFTSHSTNLVSGDTNNVQDVFVHDRSTGVTERVSISTAGVQGNSWSGVYGVVVSADGQLVAFESSATNLIAGGNNFHGIFLHDRSTGVTELVSVDSFGVEQNAACQWPAISADGKIVAFGSDANNLVAGDTNGMWDIFIHDRTSGITERVSVDSTGVQGNGYCSWSSVSADGTIVAFDSTSDDLVAGDGNATGDVFVHDRSSGVTERVSVDSNGVEGNSDSWNPVLSSDGTFVAFSSSATNLVAGDNNVHIDAFVHSRLTQVTQRVSVRSSGAQVFADSFLGGTSDDGQVVTFASDASKLVPNDTNGASDVFVHELCSTVASWSNYGNGFPGTSGIPSFTSRQNPVLGTTVTLDLANSYGSPTVGLLFLGFQPTSIHSNWGGDLLVVPALAVLISFSYGDDSFTGDIPLDDALCGFAIDLQAIEADPGAAKGVSFTPGLELILGR